MDEEDELHFCWDAAKADANLAKHGVTFEAATYVFDDSDRLDEEDIFSRGEYRAITIGRVDGVILTVAYATPEENLCRIISARRATPDERKSYERSNIHP